MYKTFPSLLFVCLFLILCLWHLCILHTHHISVPTSPFQELLLIVCGSWLHTDNETLEHPLASNILVFSNFIFGLRLECQCVLMYTVFYGLKHWEERCLRTIKDSWLAQRSLGQFEGIKTFLSQTGFELLNLRGHDVRGWELLSWMLCRRNQEIRWIKSSVNIHVRNVHTGREFLNMFEPNWWHCWGARSPMIQGMTVVQFLLCNLSWGDVRRMTWMLERARQILDCREVTMCFLEPGHALEGGVWKEALQGCVSLDAQG